MILADVVGKTQLSYLNVVNSYDSLKKYLSGFYRHLYLNSTEAFVIWTKMNLILAEMKHTISLPLDETSLKSKKCLDTGKWPMI